jgi:bifunctional ADP-heptose synthase (sugar kinase/adenylyltransferase)
MVGAKAQNSEQVAGAGLADRLAQGNSVDERAKHAHVVAGNTVTTFGCHARTANDVAAANHDRQLRAFAALQSATSPAMRFIVAASWPKPWGQPAPRRTA